MHNFFLLLWRISSRMACVLLCALLAGASGSGLQAEADRIQQRHAFLQAEQAIQDGKLADYYMYKRTLRGYPLLPYLEYKEAQNDLTLGFEDTTRHFLHNYSSTRLADKLRNDWISQLANQGRWQELLDATPPEFISSTKLRCQRISALLATGQTQQALDQVKPIWLAGHPQPDTCNPVFAAWNKSGQLTTELIWKRIALAMPENQLTLVYSLKNLLPVDEQHWAERWLRVQKDPGFILDSTEFMSPHVWREQILLFGLNQLARKYPRKVPAAWEAIKHIYPFSSTQIAEAIHIVAVAYLRIADANVIEKLDNIDGVIDADLQARRIVLALIQGHWTDVNTRIEALTPSERNDPQWLYWRGRALQQLGRRSEAQALFIQASKDRTYYAFLAADRGGLDYYLTDQPLQVASEILHEVEQMDAAIYAQELRSIGRMADARLEWRWLTQNLDLEKLKAAAFLANDWGWRDQAIFTLAKGNYWNDLNIRFPLDYIALVKQYASANGIPPAWVFAIIRQESAFAPDATSSAGALGLMQLMSATARQIAKEINLPLLGNADLLRPEVSIPLGSNYLSKIAQKFNYNLVLATAAYNAGPGRVGKWLPDKSIDADIWIETIPYRETRAYVQKVMAYMVLYEQRLGLKPGSILQRMHPVHTSKDFDKIAANRAMFH